MSIFNLFRQPPPPPPFYKARPVATAAVILTMIGMFVLGPIGAIYTGLTEDLKEKANNETVLLYMKQQKETDDRQWKAIEKRLEPPKGLTIGGKSDTIVKPKVALTPTEFTQYMNMTPERRVAYKKYLERMGKNVSGLPD